MFFSVPGVKKIYYSNFFRIFSGCFFMIFSGEKMGWNTESRVRRRFGNHEFDDDSESEEGRRHRLKARAIWSSGSKSNGVVQARAKMVFMDCS